MLRVVGGALDCSVESFPTVDRVSIRPADRERHSGRHVLDKGSSRRHQTCTDIPFKVIVLKPHIGKFGVSFRHDAVPQLSGFLDVLAVERLEKNYEKKRSQCDSNCHSFWKVLPWITNCSFSLS